MGQDIRRPAGTWGATHLAAANPTGQAEAAALLKACHRQVEEWFVEFAQARSRQRKRERALAPGGPVQAAPDAAAAIRPLLT